MERPVTGKSSWPKTADGTTDWEIIFEDPDSGLVPLVMQARSLEGLRACAGVIINQLFTRKNDAAHKARLHQILERAIQRAEAGESVDLARDGVVKILRSIKQERVLKAAAYVAKKKREADRGRGSAIERRGLPASLDIFGGRKMIIASVAALSVVVATLVGIAYFMGGGDDPVAEPATALPKVTAPPPAAQSEPEPDPQPEPEPEPDEKPASSPPPPVRKKPEYPKTVYFEPLYWTLASTKERRIDTYYQAIAVVTDRSKFTTLCRQLPNIRDAVNLALARAHPDVGMAGEKELAEAARMARKQIAGKLGTGLFVAFDVVRDDDDRFDPKARPCRP